MYISSRTVSACHTTAAQLTALGPGKCVSLPADLESFEECQRVKKEIQQREGGESETRPRQPNMAAAGVANRRADHAPSLVCYSVRASNFGNDTVLHVLVNNSGRTYTAPLDQHTDSAWNDLMTLNVQRVFTLVQALAPLLEEGHRSLGTGRVINVGSGHFDVSVRGGQTHSSARLAQCMR